MSSNRSSSTEYVFIPIINNIGNSIKITNANKSGGKTIKINGQDIEISKNPSDHRTYIDKGGNIRNILVITNYAVDENSGKLIPTLDPCDYVKGILVAVNDQPQSTLKLKLPTSKLYILRKGEIPNELTVNIFIDSCHSSNIINITNTKFKTINDNLDNVYNFFNEIYQIDKSNQEKVKKDIQELFNYYALSDKLSW